MSRNPFYNAVLAAGYITVVASIMFYGPKIAAHREDSVLAPIAILSLFVLSVAVMGYLFILQPTQLYLDGEKGEAVKLFLQTVGAFAVITLVLLLMLFIGVA